MIGNLFKKKLDINELENVTGGSITSRYSDSEYEAAGITVEGSGWLYNDGYRYQNAPIHEEEADALVYFYQKYNYHSSSVRHALEIYWCDEFCLL